MPYDPSEIYVTESYPEANTLVGQMALENCRSTIHPMQGNNGVPFYVVQCLAPEAYERARNVRRRLFGS